MSTYEVAPPAVALARLDTLPRGAVLLETSPSFASIAVSGSAVVPRVARFSLNEVTIELTAPRPGLLVCSESNMSGWSATVDGRPTPILAANYAFRAVEVPAGAHTVRLVYWPPGLTAGLALALLGLIACAIAPRRSRHPTVHDGGAVLHRHSP